DLENRDIAVGKLRLKDSDIALKMEEQKSAESEPEPEEKPKEKTEETPFAWPDWKVEVAQIDFENNHLRYQTGEKPNAQKEFDPDYIDLRDFVFKTGRIALGKNEKARAKITDFSFKES